jgi:SAM-dependent methyltransferase
MKGGWARILLTALLEDDLRAVRALVGHRLDGTRRTLEVGCGPGILADLFAGGDYVGVDEDARAIDAARRGRPGTFLCERPTRMELPDRRFDQALACDVLGGLRDSVARAVIAEVRRVLVPDGRFVVIERAAKGGRVERMAREAGRVESRALFRSGLRWRAAFVVAAGGSGAPAAPSARGTSARGTAPGDRPSGTDAGGSAS